MDEAARLGESVLRSASEHYVERTPRARPPGVAGRAADLGLPAVDGGDGLQDLVHPEVASQRGVDGGRARALLERGGDRALDELVDRKPRVLRHEQELDP